MARFLYIFLLIPILTSCSDIFSTRDAEEPDGVTDDHFYQSASELLSGFKVSLSGLDQFLYESLFLNSPVSDERYRYISEASDIASPDIFDDWNIENEKEFITGLKKDSTAVSDIRLDHSPIDEDADSLKIDLDYFMKISKQKYSYEISGKFTFDLVKQNGHFWYIRTWTDRSPSGKSFSSLKEPYVY
ncbi:MAG: hypothetical protein R6V47_06300 [Candidatus Delongbacteria bacterium]